MNRGSAVSRESRVDRLQLQSITACVDLELQYNSRRGTSIAMYEAKTPLVHLC